MRGVACSTRRVLAIALAMVLLASTDAGAAPSTTARRSATTTKPAERQKEISRELARLRDQVEDATAEEAALLDKVDEVRARRAVLDAKVAGFDRQLRAASAELATAEERLSSLTAELDEAEDRLAELTADLDAAKETLHDQAIAAYVGQPASQAADVVLGTRDLRDLAARVGYLRTVVQLQQDAVSGFAEQRDETDAARDVLARSRDDLGLQRDVVARHKANLEAARAKQAAARAEVAAEQAEEERLLQAVRTKKSAAEARIASLKRESDSIAALLRSVQRGQGITPSGKGVLAMPIPGSRITSRFGPRVHPILGTTRVHTGIDISGSTGTPIRSAGDGTVVFAGVRGGYGNTIIVDHGGSIGTLYAHQSSLAAAKGAKVRRGQIIGRVGSTGFSTGPHLHFEVRLKGNPVDPLLYL